MLSPSSTSSVDATTAERLPRLLIVDDDTFNRLLMQRLFEPDYTLTCAENGQQALDALAADDFDVVLLDIMMPDIDGYTVLERIRANPTTADLPVILISALSNNNDIARGLQMGANDYLTKPVNLLVAQARVQTQVKLKQLSDERKGSIARLEQFNALRERFFRVASHDLKSPLNNIRMAHFLLRGLVPETPEVNRTLDNLDLIITDMQNIINNLMDATILQAGKLELNIDLVELSGALYSVVNQFEAAAARKHITLRVEKAEGLALADAERLMQVLNNLVSNAIKYSPRESTVTLWTETTHDIVRISVRDQGPGVPADERDKLFTEFGKLSPRPTGGETSTGLGLWIVDHLMRLQHGRVGVDFPPEGGSVFWIEFPRGSF